MQAKKFLSNRIESQYLSESDLGLSQGIFLTLSFHSYLLLVGFACMLCAHLSFLQVVDCRSSLSFSCWLLLSCVGFRFLVFECRCRFSRKNFIVGAPTLHSMHMENAQELTFLQILTIYFFPNSTCSEYKSTEKSKEIYLSFEHFCVTSHKECTRIQRTFGLSSSLLLSEELPHGAGRRFEPGTYFALCRRLQLIASLATLIPD